MIETSADVKELFTAIHKAQAELDGVAKDSTNPHFKNRYASLENVVTAAKRPLQDAGLSFTQAPGALVDGAIEVTTMIMHTSGQWLRSTLHVPLSKRDPQGVGSAITYGCRYSLMATLGLPPIDDDAESAIDRAPRRVQPPQETLPPAAPNEAAQRLIDDARSAATNGTFELNRFWNKLTISEKAVLKPHMEPIKAVAEKTSEAA